MTVHVFVFDALTRRPIQGAFVQVQQLSATTNEHGEITLALPTPATYKIMASAPGYTPVWRDANFGLWATIADVYLSPAPPSFQDSTGGEPIGTSCVLKEFSFGGSGVRFEIRHPTAGRIHQGEYYDDVKEAGQADPRCWEKPPDQQPVPAPEGAIEKVEKQIQSLWDTAGEILKASQEEAKAWRAGILDLEARLKLWIESMILELLLRALDREVEKNAK